MRGDTESSDLKACLDSIAGLVNHANELAKRSIQAGEAGHLKSTIDITLEIEVLLDEAAQRLTVAHAINEQIQEIVDAPRNAKDLIQ